MASVSPVADDLFMVDGVPLKIRLARAERMRKVTSFGMVLPLLAFLIITFAWPIIDMLTVSVRNPEMGEALPNFSAQLLNWNTDEFPPPHEVLEAFVRDMVQAEKDRTIGLAAKRLNYHVSGFRTLIKKTGGKLERAVESEGIDAVVADPGLWDRIVEIDADWGKKETWVIMKQASPPTTAFYLLRSVDREYDSVGNVVRVPDDVAIFVNILVRTIGISFVVTLLCLALGFPIAYLLGTLPTRQSNLLILLLLLPFWTSLLVRTTSWLVLLQNEGVVNDLGTMLGLWHEPLELIRNRLGVYIAMVHIELPLMTLPLYAVMKGIDPYHMKAAMSLGANPVRSFVRVYLPQTMPGIGAGVLLVFILSLGYYITPALVGGPSDQMLSYFIAFHANQTVNWGLAASLSLVLMACVLIFFGMYQRVVGVGNIRMG